jgi:hypothetical protein
MDPLSITAAVLGISTVALRVTKTLSGLISSYHHASITVTAICSESALISAALSQIQSLMFQSGDSIVDRFADRSDLCNTFDIALTGCQLLFSCLETEVADLQVAVSASGTLPLRQKVKTLWKQDVMASLLLQLRGQATALNLLLQGLQMESTAEIRDLLKKHGNTLDQIKATTRSLRRAYPSNHVPESIIDTCRSLESIFQPDVPTVRDQEFSFDDLVIDSKAYRRAMASAEAAFAAKSRSKLKVEPKPATTNQLHSTPQSPIVTAERLRKSNQGSLTWYAPRAFKALFLPSPLLDDDASPPITDWKDSLLHWENMFDVSEHELGDRSIAEIFTAKRFWKTFIDWRTHLDQFGIAIEFIANPSLTRQFATEQLPGYELLVNFCYLYENKFHFYEQLLEQWQANGPWTVFDAVPFRDYIYATQPTLVSYMRILPLKMDAIRSTMSTSPSLQSLTRQHLRSVPPSDLDLQPWEHYLMLPITHLWHMLDTVGTLHAAAMTTEKADLQGDTIAVIAQILKLLYACHHAVIQTIAGAPWLSQRTRELIAVKRLMNSFVEKRKANTLSDLDAPFDWLLKKILVEQSDWLNKFKKL